MGVVMITCPNTGLAFSTGIESDPRTFAYLPDSHQMFALWKVHVWWPHEAWLAADGSSDAATVLVRQRPGWLESEKPSDGRLPGQASACASPLSAQTRGGI
jgi:hypothetical protein